MPTAAISGQTTFGSNTSGTTTQLDNNFLLAYNALNSFNQYSNYLVDSGAANAYVVTAPAGTTATLAAGLPVQFKAATANTGASTLNVNGTGVKNILNPDASALGSGQIPLGAVVSVIYDGTQYIFVGASYAKGGSSLALISSAVASSSATIDFTSGISTTYDEYLLTFNNLVPATNNTDLWLRFSEDAGVTFKAGATDYRWAVNAVNDSATNNPAGSGAGDTKMRIQASLANTNVASGEVRVYLPGGSANNKTVSWHFTGVLNGPNCVCCTGAGLFQLDTNAINGFRFLMSSGAIAQGNFYMYGIRKA